MEHAYNIHTVFDLLSVVLAILCGGLVYLWRFRDPLEKTVSHIGTGYFFALSLGSILGSFALGTGNLYLSGEPMIGRSILGALFGATITVELYKKYKGTQGSTGYIYVIPFCIVIIIGRLGCFLSGLDDHTYGTPTSLPWGWDFGDNIMRHPVQLYESLSMFTFVVFVLSALKYKRDLIIYYGFYICVGFYASQRFIWEFLKPYSTIIGSMNIFHIVCLILISYSIFMITKVKNGYRIA